MRGKWIRLAMASALMVSGMARGDPSVQRGEGKFEGELSYAVSRYSAATGRALERSTLKIYASDENLLISPLDAIEAFASMAPPGLDTALFRQKEGDLVLYGKAQAAYRFRPIDLMLLGLALKTMTLTDTPANVGEPQELGTFLLRNFKVALFRYEGPGETRLDLYLCDDYRIEWGGLAGSWLFGSGGLSISRLDSLLAEGRLPVRVEVFVRDRKIASLNLMKAEEGPAPAKTFTASEGKALRPSTLFLKELVTEQ